MLWGAWALGGTVGARTAHLAPEATSESCLAARELFSSRSRSPAPPRTSPARRSSCVEGIAFLSGSRGHQAGPVGCAVKARYARRRLRASRCRPRSRLGSDRPLAEPGGGGGGGGGGGEGSWQPAASRSEEGAPRPTLLPAWSAAAPDTHGRAGFRAAKSQCRTPGPGVRTGAEVSGAPGAGTRTWAEDGARRGDSAAGRGPDGGGGRARVGRGRGVARPGFVWRRREAAGGRVGAAGECSGSSVAGWERALGAEAQCHQVWGGDVGRRGAGPRELCECVLGGDGEPAARCIARSRVSGLRGPLVVTQDMALAACPRPGLYAGPR